MLSKGGDLRDGEAVTVAVRSTSFPGVAGTLVELDSNGDRINSYEVMNYVLGPSNVIRSVTVGVYNSSRRRYMPYEQAVLWPGNTTEVPVDLLSGGLNMLPNHAVGC